MRRNTEPVALEASGAVWKTIIEMAKHDPGAVRAA